jgi:hypothetical protein
MHQNNNLLSISSGIFLSVSNYLSIVPNFSLVQEALHVLVVGIIGGAGGWLGKVLIQQTVQLFKKLIK